MDLFEGFLGLFSNFPTFDATERLFRSNWGRISPEIDWCYCQLAYSKFKEGPGCFGPYHLTLRGSMDPFEVFLGLFSNFPSFDAT